LPGLFNHSLQQTLQNTFPELMWATVVRDRHVGHVG